MSWCQIQDLEGGGGKARTINQARIPINQFLILEHTTGQVVVGFDPSS